jgi:hypothetical protein
MHPLATDIRNMCHSIMPGWEDDGMWGNKIEIHGYVLSARGNGGAYVPPEICVAVQRLDARNGSSLPFYRSLDREGCCRNELGVVVGSTPYSSDWMKTSIHEALVWIGHHPI